MTNAIIHTYDVPPKGRYDHMAVRPLCRPGITPKAGKKAWNGGAAEGHEAKAVCDALGYAPSELIWHPQNALRGMTDYDAGKTIDMSHVGRWCGEFASFARSAPRMLGVSIDDVMRRSVADLGVDAEYDERWLPLWIVKNAWGPQSLSMVYTEPDVASWMNPSDVFGPREGPTGWKARAAGLTANAVPWLALSVRGEWTKDSLSGCAEAFASAGVQHVLVFTDSRDGIASSMSEQWDLLDTFLEAA